MLTTDPSRRRADRSPTHSRSTSRRKTGAQIDRERAYLRGLCRALDYMGVMTETAVYIALRDHVLAECPSTSHDTGPCLG